MYILRVGFILTSFSNYYGALVPAVLGDVWGFLLIQNYFDFVFFIAITQASIYGYNKKRPMQAAWKTRDTSIECRKI